MSLKHCWNMVLILTIRIWLVLHTYITWYKNFVYVHFCCIVNVAFHTELWEWEDFLPKVVSLIFMFMTRDIVWKIATYMYIYKGRILPPLDNETLCETLEFIDLMTYRNERKHSSRELLAFPCNRLMYVHMYMNQHICFHTYVYVCVVGYQFNPMN